MENTECRICHNTAGNQSHEVKEMLFGFRDKFDYFQCASCGCLQISKIPPNMSKYYRSDYYSYTFKINELKKSKNTVLQFLKGARNDYAIFNRGLLGKFLYALSPVDWVKERLSKHFPGMPTEILFTKKSGILDVGCGNGKLLYFFKELGFEDVLGIDPYGKDILYPNGLKVKKTFLHNIDRHFDLIMFHHSFEHIVDPVKTLQHVSRLLAKNGKCVIRIPTVDAPRHFHVFSKKSIHLLAHMAGLELIKIVYDSDEFQFFGSEQYKRDIPLTAEQSYVVNKDKSIFSEKEILMFRKEALRLNAENQGDCAAFYLQKQD